MPHLNNKKSKNTNLITRRQDYHLTQPCPSEEKQTSIQKKKKKKTSTQVLPYMKLTQTTGANLGEQKPKGRKNSTLKPGEKRPQTQQVKKTIMRRQRNSTQMKEQTRNTEVQINEEEIGNLPEKEFIIMIVKMIKTLKTKWRKCKNQLTKT